MGTGHPVYVTGEIGINHNGDLANALALIDRAAEAGCDAVKFQKRTPRVCTPRDQWDIERDTPWGRMTYLDYRHRVEFGAAEYAAIDDHARRARHRLVRLAVGHRIGGLPRAVRPAGVQGRLGLPDRR